MSTSSPADLDELLDREVEAIVRALRENGDLSREELANVVRARTWGPGRFGSALREAVEDGRVQRVAGRRWSARG